MKIFVIFLLALTLVGCQPPKCTETSPVMEIISVDYRDGTVALENGMVKTINQGTYKKGTEICVSYEK